MVAHRVIKDGVMRANVAFWKLIFTFLSTPSSQKPLKIGNDETLFYNNLF